MCFSKKKKREKGEYGWHCYTWHGRREKSWGLLLSKKQFISHGCAREEERGRGGERGKRPRFWVTRPRVIPVTESACVKRCPIARSAQPFRPDGNHLPRDYHAYTHCSIFLEEGWWWWWWSLGRRLVDCKNCYFFFFSSLFFFFTLEWKSYDTFEQRLRAVVFRDCFFPAIRSIWWGLETRELEGIEVWGPDWIS